MTCIVAIVEAGKVFMACDSAGVSELSIRARKDKKIFMRGDLLIGFTTSFRFGQILQHELVPPKHYGEIDAYSYMVSVLIPAMRDVLKNHGYTKVENNEEKGGTCLVGFKGRLFTIYDDFQVAENLTPYESVGCGSDLAMGALHTTQCLSIELSPKSQLLTALEAADKYSAGVCRPFHFFELDSASAQYSTDVGVKEQ